MLDVPLLSCHFCMKRGTFIEFESICLLLHVDLLKRHVCVVGNNTMVSGTRMCQASCEYSTRVPHATFLV